MSGPTPAKPWLFVLHSDLREGIRDGRGNERAERYAKVLNVRVVELRSNRDDLARTYGVTDVPALATGNELFSGTDAIDALEEQLDATVEGGAQRIEIDRKMGRRVTSEPMVPMTAGAKRQAPREL